MESIDLNDDEVCLLIQYLHGWMMNKIRANEDPSAERDLFQKLIGFRNETTLKCAGYTLSAVGVRTRL